VKELYPDLPASHHQDENGDSVLKTAAVVKEAEGKVRALIACRSPISLITGQDTFMGSQRWTELLFTRPTGNVDMAANY
jgi:hypothetical protein